MIRFALILLMSLAVSSQAFAAIKWNNPGTDISTDDKFKASDIRNSILIAEFQTRLKFLGEQSGVINAKFNRKTKAAFEKIIGPNTDLVKANELLKNRIGNNKKGVRKAWLCHVEEKESKCKQQRGKRTKTK